MARTWEFLSCLLALAEDNSVFMRVKKGFNSPEQWTKKIAACLLWPLLYPLGEGNGTPLQYSCLENHRDGGAWWAAVYGVAQSRTRLKRLSSSSSSSIPPAYGCWGGWNLEWTLYFPGWWPLSTCDLVEDTPVPASRHDDPRCPTIITILFFFKES